MSRIGPLFEKLKKEGRCALIAYITAGDPAPARTASLVSALERGGADLIELGVPFSDPIADGPVIQHAGERALKAGTTLRKVLEIAREIRQKSQVPIVLFTYLNPVLKYGLVELARDAANAGIDGCLLTDASVEEAEIYIRVMKEAGLDTVFLAAPTSSERRLKLVAKYSTGFVYLVSRTGVTGVQTNISSSVAPLIEAVRALTDLPLAVGFGVSTRAHFQELEKQADGVIVGSAFMRMIEENIHDPQLEQKLEDFARDLVTSSVTK